MIAELKELFRASGPAWQIILRSLAVYLSVLAGLRLSGKREIGQMTVFDLVVLLLLANSVQNAMVGGDNSLAGGLLSAAVLLAANAIVARLRMRWPRLRHLIEGSPTLLVLRGEVIASHMKAEGLDQETLEAALREHGVASIGDVDMAVLEIDGSISVVQPGQQTRRIKRPAKFLRHQ